MTTVTNLRNGSTALVYERPSESDLQGWHAQAPQVVLPFKIGPWLVQPSHNLLVRDGIQKKVGRKVMELLLFLASRAGDIVEKKEILTAVWENCHVSDMALTVTVSHLRSALGDNARAPIFLKTISGVGYKLMQVPVVVRQPQKPVEKTLPGSWERQLFGFARVLFVVLLSITAVWCGYDLGMSSNFETTQAGAPTLLLERERVRIVNLAQSEEGSYFAALMRQEIFDVLKKMPRVQEEVLVEGALLSAAPKWRWRLQVTHVSTGQIIWTCESKSLPMGIVRYFPDWQRHFATM